VASVVIHALTPSPVPAKAENMGNSNAAHRRMLRWILFMTFILLTLVDVSPVDLKKLSESSSNLSSHPPCATAIL